jgi:hypothetical protein
VNYLYRVFGLGSVRSGGSRAFSLWSKYFTGISDSRGSGVNRGENDCENGGKSGRTIVAIIFRLLFRYFSSRNITRSLLAILV